MKPTILLATILFCVQSAFGQTEWYSDVVLIQKGMALQKFADDSYTLREKKGEDSALAENKIYIKEDLWEQAAAYYQELADSFPNSQLLLTTLTMKGEIEMKIDRFEEAKQTYKRVLSLCKTDTTISKRRIENVQYYAYMALATIDLDNDNYAKAVENLDKALEHPYASGCGVCGGLSPYETVRAARLYTDSYLGMGNFKSAYNYLLPVFFRHADISNHELISYRHQALLKKYTRTELQRKYEKA